MKAWKSMSLCGLLALSLVSYAAASPAPTPFLTGGAECASPGPALTPAFAAEPLSALGAAGTPSAVFAASLPWLSRAAKVCNVHCTGNPACLCLDGSHGTCVSGECTPNR